MTKYEVIKKYVTSIDVEVSEMTEEEREQVIREMEKHGFRFNRSEARYETCIMYVFDIEL